MFIEIGTFKAPKTVLCLGMRPHPDGVIVNFLHSNQSRLEFASEQIAGLQHYQLHLALTEPPYNPVSPFLNLKRENVPAIIAWSEHLEQGGRNPNERPVRGKSARPVNIQVDVGTYSSPKTVSPIVFQPDGNDASISYLDDAFPDPRSGGARVLHLRIAGLSYEQLLMAFKSPPPDRNSPFLNLKVENIPAVIEHLRRSAEAASNLEHTSRRVVGFPEAGKQITNGRHTLVADQDRYHHVVLSTP